jgi:RNase P/RNase MRP subunit POP5
MKLKPSMKSHRRYILLESGTKEEIEKIILDYTGILGWAKAEPIFLRNKDSKLILSVNREEVDNIRAAFEASPFGIKVLRVSGTLKGLEK